MRNRNAVLIVVALFLLVLVVGCQSPSPTTQPATAALSPACQRAVMCDKCVTTWAPSYTINGKAMVMYTVEPQKVCPDCAKAAKEYLDTGKVPPEACPTCGGHMRVCKAVECKTVSK
jgi:hypothetical protein